MTTPQQASLNAFSARIASNSLTASDVALLTAALGNIVPAWGFGGSGAPPDFLGYGGQTDEPNAREWFATLYAIAEGTSSGGGPVVPASWLVPAWFINPVAGSDLNSGQDAGHPLKTWAQLVNLWGTVSPTLGQNTTITFQASQPDNTDPVIFRPVVTNNSQIAIVGAAPTLVSTIVLAGTVVKNRATPQLLNGTLGGTGAVGQLLQNTTHPSRAWVYKLVAGTTFAISQPLTATAVPNLTVPSEVDTWTNGDSVQLLALVGINLVEVNPIVADLNAAATNGVTLYQFAITNPTGAPQLCYIGANVNLQEVSSKKTISGKVAAPFSTSGLQSATNCFLGVNGVFGNFVGGTWQFIGGTIQGIITGTSIVLDGDIIVTSSSTLNTDNSGDTNLGLVYLDTGAPLSLQGPQIQAAATNFASTIIWGPGGLSVVGMSNLRYNGTAVGAFVLTGGLSLDTDTTANSIIVGAPDVLNGGITLTAAHLDAAAGAAGFGGKAWRFGGGSITAN